MSLEKPKVCEKEYTTMDQDAIHFMGPDVPPVLATPSLVNWMELTSRENVQPLLEAGDDTVVVSLSIKHFAATPVGMKVRVTSKLVKTEGRRYFFELEAFDEHERIGEAVHERASVNVAKFGGRVSAKQQKAGHAG